MMSAVSYSKRRDAMGPKKAPGSGLAEPGQIHVTLLGDSVVAVQESSSRRAKIQIEKCSRRNIDYTSAHAGIVPRTA